MALQHYPKRLRHQREHQRFTAVLADLTAQLESHAACLDRDQLLNRINENIIDWLFEHICMEDRALARHLNPRPVLPSVKIHQLAERP